MVPGTDPLAALSQELVHALGSTASPIREQLAQDKGLLRMIEDLLRGRVTSPPRRRMLMVIDQFEEILTRSSTTDRAQLAKMLHPAITGPLQAVATVRSEFLDTLLADPALASLPIYSVTLRPLATAVCPG